MWTSWLKATSEKRSATFVRCCHIHCIYVHVFPPPPPSAPSLLLSPSPSFPSAPAPRPSLYAVDGLSLRQVALKAVDPTYWTTLTITGPVALCAPPFGSLSLLADYPPPSSLSSRYLASFLPPQPNSSPAPFSVLPSSQLLAGPG